MANRGVALSDLHVGLGLRHRLVVEQQRIAANERLGAGGALVDMDESSVGGDAAVLGD